MKLTRAILFLLLMFSLIAPEVSRLRGAAEPTPSQTVQTPSEIARMLANEGKVLDLPFNKRTKYKIEKAMSLYTLESGESRVVLVRLPTVSAGQILRLDSYADSRKVFVPAFVFLDSGFQKSQQPDGPLFVDACGLYAELSPNVTDAYLLIHARSNSVGQLSHYYQRTMTTPNPGLGVSTTRPISSQCIGSDTGFLVLKIKKVNPK